MTYSTERALKSYLKGKMLSFLRDQLKMRLKLLRNARGDEPYFSLNTLEKWVMLLKPQLKAMSVIFR